MSFCAYVHVGPRSHLFLTSLLYLLLGVAVTMDAWDTAVNKTSIFLDTSSCL